MTHLLFITSSFKYKLLSTHFKYEICLKLIKFKFCNKDISTQEKAFWKTKAKIDLRQPV